MHEKLEKKTEESIKKILDEGITTNNLDHLYKLTKINVKIVANIFITTNLIVMNSIISRPRNR